MAAAAAAGHELTARTAADVLAAGGNAVDATVAAAAMSWASEPGLISPCGGGFLLVRPARTGKLHLLDAFTAIPGTGTAGRPQVQGPAVGGGFNLFFSGLPRFPFSAILTALESSGLAKMLAEPTLVALSGQEAKFLVGGEFPIPMTTGLGAVNVAWKKFGIILNFTPTVLDEHTIHLKLKSEVSDVDPARCAEVMAAAAEVAQSADESLRTRAARLEGRVRRLSGCAAVRNQESGTRNQEVSGRRDQGDQEGSGIRR